jgi:DNA-binding NarL/FixJ family response regulator
MDTPASKEITAYLIGYKPEACAPLEASMRALGCIILGSALNGRLALRTIARLKPQLVFLDIILPGMAGLECAQQLKAVLPDLQVFVVTAAKDPCAAKVAQINGVTAYLLLPLIFDELRTALQTGATNRGLSVNHFYCSAGLSATVEMSESCHQQLYPSFLTRTLCELWHQNQEMPGFWLEFAKRNGFCVKCMAAEIAVSPRHMQRIWVKCFGLPPKEWLQLARGMLCARWLKAGKKPKELVQLCGYNDISHLYQNKIVRNLILWEGAVSI